MANGALNHCSNVEQDLKILGSKKFNRAHNSGNLFCKNPDIYFLYTQSKCHNSAITSDAEFVINVHELHVSVTCKGVPVRRRRWGAQ